MPMLPNVTTLSYDAPSSFMHREFAQLPLDARRCEAIALIDEVLASYGYSESYSPSVSSEFVSGLPESARLADARRADVLLLHGSYNGQSFAQQVGRWMSVYGMLSQVASPHGDHYALGARAALLDMESRRRATLSPEQRVAEEVEAGDYSSTSVARTLNSFDLSATDDSLARFWFAALNEDSRRFSEPTVSRFEIEWLANPGVEACTGIYCERPSTVELRIATRGRHTTRRWCSSCTPASCNPHDRPRDESWLAEVCTVAYFANGGDTLVSDPYTYAAALADTASSLVACPRCSVWHVLSADDGSSWFARNPCHNCGHRTMPVVVHGHSAHAPRAALVVESERRASNTTYFGIELEFEFNAQPSRERSNDDDDDDESDDEDDGGTSSEDGANLLYDYQRPDTYIYKHDGSLRCGAELVTAPASAAWWRSDKASWSELFANLRRNGFRSYDTETCGMHIHISRTAFTPTSLYSLMSLLYENASLFKTLCQRDGNNYCSYSGSDSRNKKSRLAKAKLIRPYWSNDADFNDFDRYVAVNLPPDKPTVELRGMRGTLNVDSFYKNIEMAVSLTDFVNQAGMRDGASGSAYLKYVLSRSKQYPHLTAFVNEHRRKVANSIGLTAHKFENTLLPLAHAERPARAKLVATPTVDARRPRSLSFASAGC